MSHCTSSDRRSSRVRSPSASSLSRSSARSTSRGSCLYVRNFFSADGKRRRNNATTKECGQNRNNSFDFIPRLLTTGVQAGTEERSRGKYRPIPDAERICGMHPSQPGDHRQNCPVCPFIAKVIFLALPRRVEEPDRVEGVFRPCRALNLTLDDSRGDGAVAGRPSRQMRFRGLRLILSLARRACCPPTITS